LNCFDPDSIDIRSLRFPLLLTRLRAPFGFLLQQVAFLLDLREWGVAIVHLFLSLLGCKHFVLVEHHLFALQKISGRQTLFFRLGYMQAGPSRPLLVCDLISCSVPVVMLGRLVLTVVSTPATRLVSHCLGRWLVLEPILDDACVPLYEVNQPGQKD